MKVRCTDSVLRFLLADETFRLEDEPPTWLFNARGQVELAVDYTDSQVTVMVGDRIWSTRLASTD